MEFGCGVGRLLIPFIKAFKPAAATGYDISEGMLLECEANLKRSKVRTKSKLKTSLDDSTYDFAYTYYVLQHIDRVRGEGIFAKILGNLNPGGVAVIHFTISCAVREEVMVPDWFYNILRTRGALIRLVKAFLGFDPGDPEMKIIKYDLAKMVLTAEDLGCSLRHTEVLRHGGSVVGVVLYLVKPR